MRVEEGYISCLDNIDLILLCDTLFIPFHRQFIDSQFSKDPYPTPHLYSVGDDWFPFCPRENNQCDRLNPPPPLRFPPQTINNDSCPLVTILVKRPGKGSLIHGGEYKLGGLFELAFAH